MTTVESLDIFDFNPWISALIFIFTIVGVIGREIHIWSVDESAYKWEERKGDIVFSLFFAPMVNTFGMPYFWMLVEGMTVPGLGYTFTLNWHNIGFAMFFGYFFRVIARWVGSVFKNTLSGLKKKIANKVSE